MADTRLGYGYADRRRMGDSSFGQGQFDGITGVGGFDQPKGQHQSVVTKECAICTKLVDRETLFNGVCKECLDVDKEHCNEPR